MKGWSLLILGCWLLSGGGQVSAVWNDPYAESNPNQKVLYSSFRERPKHLDPAKSYSSNEIALIAQIYEPPFQYHYLKRPYTLIPGAAANMPEIRYYDAEGEKVSDPEQAAFSEYIISLRPDLVYQPHPALAKNASGEFVYHNLSLDDLADVYTLADFESTGQRAVVADDYIYQIKRLADPAIHSPVAGIFSNYIVGFSEFTADLKKARETDPDASIQSLNMSGVRKVDDQHYAIRLKGLYPQFIYWMSMPFFAPVPWEAEAFYKQEGMDERNISLDWYPLGSGPYMLVENNPNLRMTMVKNPNFHGENYPSEGSEEDRKAGLLDDAGKPIPFIEKVVYSLEKESIPYWNKFLQGYYDNSGVSSDSFDQAIQFSAGELELTPQMRDKAINLATAVNSSVYYMGFNMKDPVVGGLSERATLLRRAISIAVDYEEYISIFLNGRGSAAQGILPPGIFGYQGGEKGINPFVYEWKNGKPVRKSLDEAKRLLAEAGYEGGIDPDTGKALILNLDTVGAGPDSKANLQWMIKQYNKLGIQLVIRNTDYNRFQEKMRKGTAQIFQWGWNADYPDPENFFFLLYGPNGKVDAHGENAANYVSTEFDALFEQMKDMPNGPERLAIIEKMKYVARRDAPWVFGINPKLFTLFHSWYRNAKPNLMANNTLKYKDINPQLRAEKQQDWNQPVVWPLIIFIVLLFASVIPAVIAYRKREQGGAL